MTEETTEQMKARIRRRSSPSRKQRSGPRRRSKRSSSKTPGRAGGTEEEFEEEWPGMRTEMLKRRTIEDDANARVSSKGVAASAACEHAQTD
jgi:hypothetical protein